MYNTNKLHDNKRSQLLYIIIRDTSENTPIVACAVHFLRAMKLKGVSSATEWYALSAYSQQALYTNNGVKG